ncbi:MAG TPA: DUF58 domain-containing protein [Terriglobales bacterium]|nr:DUF58 domain-containing protein [Terriglobales bacterium]
MESMQVAISQSTLLNKLANSFRAENSGAWMRFLLAAVGLTMAFAAAIFSTAARDAGNVIATVLLASLALLIAVSVGLGTVPYLARRVGARRVRDALDFEVTKTGVFYALVVLLIGIAALNTGNNLLYIIVAAMLAAIAVSGLASAFCLRGLDLELKIPEHIFAGTEVAATVCVRNPRRWIPSISVSAVPIEKKTEQKSWQLVKTSFPVPPWRPPEQQWLQLPDRKLRRVTVGTPSGVFHEAAYFPIVPAGCGLEASVKLNFRRRGCYQERFSLSTRFPFAFLVKTRRAALSREVLVYPEITSSQEAIELVPLLTGKFETHLRGIGSDLYRIREYLPEDPARQVDWKATAKSGSLKVREFSRDDERRLRVVFDNPVLGVLQGPRYERMVSLTASLVWRLAEQNVYISFVSQEYESFGDIFGVLRYLATATPKNGPSILETLSASTDYSVVFTVHKRGTIPAGAWASSYFVFVE